MPRAQDRNQERVDPTAWNSGSAQDTVKGILLIAAVTGMT